PAECFGGHVRVVSGSMDHPFLQHGDPFPDGDGFLLHDHHLLPFAFFNYHYTDQYLDNHPFFRKKSPVFLTGVYISSSSIYSFLLYSFLFVATQSRIVLRIIPRIVPRIILRIILGMERNSEWINSFRSRRVTLSHTNSISSIALVNSACVR